LSGVLDSLRERTATTAPGHVDARLQGRTYAIPFDTVWQAALSLGGGGIRGWSIVRTNDQQGVLELLVQPSLGPHAKHVDVRVEIGLDASAQTRVDMRAVSRTERGDLGRSKRLVHRFFTHLDQRLDAGPSSILDPAELDRWLQAHASGERSPSTPAEGR
jgi:hypothetical protein